MTPSITFAMVSFCLGLLGDGLNIFQGIYLVGLGWNEGAVGTALSLMGLTALIVQTYAGDIIDKTSLDRRVLMTIASLVTAGSAMAVMFVREGNTDHTLMYITKVLEGIASSFIGPCLAALTLASFGPHMFDSIMANNAFWGHVGSSISAILAGFTAYVYYPNIQYCFYVIGFSALSVYLFIQFLPEGDASLGRGFDNSDKLNESNKANNDMVAASYLSVFSERRTIVLCVTGFFFHLANANVLLVLGEIMGQDDSANDEQYNDDNDDGKANRAAIPLVAGAILLAQFTMSITTLIGGRLTDRGVGRKTIFLTGLITLPIRCALIIYWKDKGSAYLLSTQVLDGVAGGFFGLIHPFIVADITFGTGRFNVIMGLTASAFGLGATFSNFFGQMVVQHFGHVESLSGSLVISIIPILIFKCLMPETLNTRGQSAPSYRVSGQYTEIL